MSDCHMCGAHNDDEGWDRSERIADLEAKLAAVTAEVDAARVARDAAGIVGYDLSGCIERLASENAALRAEVERLRRPWAVMLVLPWGEPFEHHECEIVDVGHSDRVLVVQCAEMGNLRAENERLCETNGRLDRENERLRGHLRRALELENRPKVFHGPGDCTAIANTHDLEALNNELFAHNERLRGALTRALKGLQVLRNMLSAAGLGTAGAAKEMIAEAVEALADAPKEKSDE